MYPWGHHINDLLPRGGVSLLIAKRGVGATTLARAMAACFAQGDEFPAFWGPYGFEAGVLFWMLSARHDSARERDYWRMSGVTARWTETVTVATGLPLGNEDSELLRKIRATGACRLVILDALPDYRPAFRRPAEAEVVLPHLRRIADSWEIHILAILPLSGRERLTAETPTSIAGGTGWTRSSCSATAAGRAPSPSHQPPGRR